MVKIHTVEEPWVHPKCKLGEGPVWEESTGRLRFVDIDGRQLLWVDPSRGPDSLERADVDDKIGFSAGIEGVEDESTLIVGAKWGFGWWRQGSRAIEYIAEPAAYWTRPDERDHVATKAARMRFNDGAVDAQGRLWCGMMVDPEEASFAPEGALFRLDPGSTQIHRVLDNLTIPNGTTWKTGSSSSSTSSSSTTTMYFTDSPRRAIVAYDFDDATAAMTRPRVWWDVALTQGPGPLPVPDGLAQDVEGGLWVALYGGSKVVRLIEDQNTGTAVIDAEIRLPTPNITCPAFVGTELWITSAQNREDASDKYGGALFRVDVGVRGKPVNRWPARPA